MKKRTFKTSRTTKAGTEDWGSSQAARQAVRQSDNGSKNKWAFYKIIDDWLTQSVGSNNFYASLEHFRSTHTHTRARTRILKSNATRKFSGSCCATRLEDEAKCWSVAGRCRCFNCVWLYHWAYVCVCDGALCVCVVMLYNLWTSVAQMKSSELKGPCCCLCWLLWQLLPHVEFTCCAFCPHTRTHTHTHTHRVITELLFSYYKA